MIEQAPVSRASQSEAEKRVPFYKAYQKALHPLEVFPPGKVIVFDLETSGFHGDHGTFSGQPGDQITQISAIAVSLPGMEQDPPFDRRVMLGNWTTAQLRKEVASKHSINHTDGSRTQHHGDYRTITQPDGTSETVPALNNFSQHLPLTLNGYHPHFRKELDEQGNPKKYRTRGTGKWEGQEHEADHLHKLTEEEFEEVQSFSGKLPDEREVLQDFVRFVESSGAYAICGHNIVTFDIPFLSHRLKNFGIENPLSKLKKFDTLYYARLVLVPAMEALDKLLTTIHSDSDRDMGDIEVWDVITKLRKSSGGYASDLQRLAGTFKAHGGKAHDSLGDVETNIKVLHAVGEFLKEYREVLESPVVKDYFTEAQEKAIRTQVDYDARGLDKEKERQEKYFQPKYGGKK